MDADEALVGREASCNVIASHPSVSRRHALIKRKQDVFFVVDQGSANGTFVDSKRVVDATLRDGSVLWETAVAPPRGRLFDQQIVGLQQRPREADWTVAAGQGDCLALAVTRGCGADSLV